MAGAIDGTAVVGVVHADATGGSAVVEHLAGLDRLLAVHPDRVELAAPPAGTPLPRPLDPLTPVSVVDALPAGDALATDVHHLVQGGRLLTAAFQVGLGQAAVDMGAAYATERQQFGKVIGSFQAVKHLLADAVVAVDIARAGVHAAAVAIDEGATEGRSMSVDAARLVAADAAQLATETCIQVHGGIGFTWELDAHLLLKRSLALDTTFGGLDASFEAVAATL